MWQAPVRGGLYLSCASQEEDWFLLVKTPGILPFLGIHPEHIAPDWLRALQNLKALLNRYKQAGIGECGLDRRFYKVCPRNIQEEVLKAQLELAGRFARPVVLHEVQAAGALAEILEHHRPPVPVMLHGFTGKGETLKRCRALDLYISFGPKAPWHKEDFCREAQNIPSNRILIESDWPGGAGAFKSHKDALEQAYERAAGALKISRNDLAELVRKNGTVFTH